MNRYHSKTTLDKRVFLVQTDTTVGFLSQDASALAALKQRPPQKPFLEVVASLKQLKQMARVPNAHKNRVRRAKKTTFVYANDKAIRYVNDHPHQAFINSFGVMYSSSANKSGLGFEKAFAITHASVVVEDQEGLFEGPSSRIYKLYHHTMKRLR